MTTVLVGAQYGSEGKGVVAHRILVDAINEKKPFSVCIRTGGPNAGHTFVHEGKKVVVQTVPCGLADPNCELLLGPGAVINPRQLAREIEMLEALGFDIRSRLYVDERATVLTMEHENQEGHTHGSMHAAIGSTGEGVGAARAARMSRSGDRILVQDRKDEFCDLMVTDTVNRHKGRMLLEGTQGSGLSLVHGPWPYTTSADTNAAQFCADAGVSPLSVREVALVARTMPIRVAGNSGPLYKELTWEQLSERLGMQVVEHTTVTKKRRRIGEWDQALFDRAVQLNRPTWVALTFMDYVNPADRLVTQWDKLSCEGLEFIKKISIPVRYAGTGVHDTDGWTCLRA